MAQAAPENTIAEVPSEVDLPVEPDAPIEALDAGASMFPPTAAEMAAMATQSEAPVDAPPEDKAKKKAKKKTHELAPKNYAAKKAFSNVLKLLGFLVLVAILVVGFLLWNRAKDTARVTELSEGTCVSEFFSPNEGEFRSVFFVDTTDCVNPHAYEVFSVSETAFIEFSEEIDGEAEYQGIEQTFVIGQQYCQAQYDEFVGGDFNTSPWQVWTFVPTEMRWEQGDRRVQCMVGDAAEVNLIEGSLRGAGESAPAN